MKKGKSLLIMFFIFLAACGRNPKQLDKHTQKQPEKVIFQAKDGLVVTADLYAVSDSLPVIILCHQARSSRGEYVETAVKLNGLGFNCLAVDLRSGDVSNGIKNETAALAKEKNFPHEYLDAEQDIAAAIDYTYKKYHKKVILFGSSYSASLALKTAVHNDLVSYVIAFSPGEYFGEELHLAKAIKKLKLPVFLTSAKGESEDVKVLFDAISSKDKVQFIPKSEGMHASKVLWSDCPSNQEYWDALISFLKKIKQMEK